MPTGAWWGKPDGKRPLGRPKHKGEDNIKLDLEQNWTGWHGGLDYLAVGKDKWWALVEW